VEFAPVRRPGELSKLTGEDVKGFRHAASNQSMQHVLKKHGNAKIEKARGQKAVTAADFFKLPAIVRSGTYSPADQLPKPGSPKRFTITSKIGADEYTYIATVRRGQRRIDLVTMWKK
jgi:hypothetical protein